ncbi:unnamed protein product [Wuchereria bancrofti]|uniref:Uncharacterized protein n=1 Tax=Wuchereria bancrofti TaxID=6293 RepID=A0A3P7EBS5_WUCBA|nr:unnamed protein product [Wuchereria bancrofti]
MMRNGAVVQRIEEEEEEEGDNGVQTCRKSWSPKAPTWKQQTIILPQYLSRKIASIFGDKLRFKKSIIDDISNHLFKRI